MSSILAPVYLVGGRNSVTDRGCVPVNGRLGPAVAESLDRAISLENRMAHIEGLV
jgi:hypothetical protein